jgi:phage repressor protein C with HTH and peptisase S24 domain
METIGERVKAAREALKKGQDWLADAVGIRQSTVWALETNKSQGTKHLLKFAQVLGQDITWLQSGEGQMRQPAPTFTSSSIASIGEIDVEASAGPGQVVEYAGEAHHWAFPEYWLRAALDAAPADIKLITIKGDSGQSDPAKATDIDPGDKVFVNIADRRPSPPGLFVLWDGLAFVAKRVQMVPGTSPIRVRLSSNNPAYQPYEVEIEDAQIQGRIVARFQRIG